MLLLLLGLLLGLLRLGCCHRPAIVRSVLSILPPLLLLLKAARHGVLRRVDEV
jgi:hypothetical protein